MKGYILLYTVDLEAQFYLCFPGLHAIDVVVLSVKLFLFYFVLFLLLLFGCILLALGQKFLLFLCFNLLKE